MRRALLAIAGALLAFVLYGLVVTSYDKPTWRTVELSELSTKLPDLPAIHVSDRDRFLNDLALSPAWRVGNSRDGADAASALSLWGLQSVLRREGDCHFLFELRSIHGATRTKNASCALQVSILFGRPPERPFNLGVPGQDVTLRVTAQRARESSTYAESNLAILLSEAPEIYLVLTEYGDDPARSATLELLPVLFAELADVAASPADYRAETRYAEIFERLFTAPLGESGIERVAGIQERDDFYGYLRARPGTSYRGVNLRVSHPIYCRGECTRDFSRLQMAKYLGQPHQDGDVVFFYFPDTAVYLDQGYTRQFGWFSGTRSFDASIQILDDGGEVLFETTGPFRGWER